MELGFTTFFWDGSW